MRPHRGSQEARARARPLRSTHAAESKRPCELRRVLAVDGDIAVVPFSVPPFLSMIVLSEVTLIGSGNRAPGREQLPSKFAGNSLPSPRTASRSLYPRTQDARKARGQRLAMLYPASRGSSRPRDHQTDHLETPHHSPPDPVSALPVTGPRERAAGAASQSFIVRSSPAEARVRPCSLRYRWLAITPLTPPSQF